MLGGLLNYLWKSKPTPSKPNRVQPKVQMTKNELLFAAALTQIMNAYQASADVWNATQYCSEHRDCYICPTTEECEERERNGNYLLLGLGLFAASSVVLLCAQRLYYRWQDRKNATPAAAANNLNAPTTPEVVEGQPQPAIPQLNIPTVEEPNISMMVELSLQESTEQERQNEAMQQEDSLERSAPAHASTAAAATASLPQQSGIPVLRQFPSNTTRAKPSEDEMYELRRQAGNLNPLYLDGLL